MNRLVIVLMAGAAVTGAYAQGAAPANRAAAQTAASRATDWPEYGHDAGGMRFSPLTQISPANVENLKPAWVYHMKPAGDAAPAGRGSGEARGGAGRGAGRGGPRGGFSRNASGFRSSEDTPLVVNGLMYIGTPYGHVTALDPDTGKEVWDYKLTSGNPATRGVAYFPGDNTTPPLVVVATSNGSLFTLNARTGALNPDFGSGGMVDLNTPAITHGLPRGNAGLSAPASLYKNLIILGDHVQENNGPGTAGDVRAFDIHTGNLVWTFHSIPRKGEPNYGTWPGDSAKDRSGVNVWGGITVDAARGIAYLPFGAPSGDEWGGDRPGNDLYDTSLVAVDAATGKYLWYFQAVHHDITDFDLEAPPLLMTVKKDGQSIPAVGVMGKNALLYLLNRVTGKPIYGVVERPVAQSEVPLEKTSPTQPFPVKPPPLAQQTMSMADLATVTPELATYCRNLVEENHIEMGGPFLPASFNHVRVNFPSSIGGANWGGASFDPALGYMFVNVNDIGQLLGVKNPARGPVSPDVVGTNIPGSRTGPYSGMRPGGRFKDNALDMFCNQPPWGEMVAVNVNTGDIAWKVPLGITPSLPAGQQNTGRPGLGGSIATASGLVFIGAVDDNYFRALDAKTGKELWSAKLESAAAAVPITYLGQDGKQYVVVTATGNGFAAEMANSDTIVAFALPPQ